MESRLSGNSSSRASSVNNEEGPSPFRASLRQDLDLWTGCIPTEEDPSFEPLIRRHTGTANLPRDEARLFEPRDQHCGLWKDAPNQDCHASFGDQGTTASVSGPGNLVQMSQFLGAGHSGVFTVDHMTTSEPYFIESRAEDLSDLGSGRANITFGMCLHNKFLPVRPPEVKWVNWRWPRCEWEKSDDSMSVKISKQWLIKHNTVFQQTIVTNKGSSRIEDFSIMVLRDMLVRDLDYLEDPTYNDMNSEDYIRGRGPGGFSWITANFLGNEKSVTSREKDTSGIHTNFASGIDDEGDRLQSHGEREATSQNKQPSPLSEASGDEHLRSHTTAGQANSEHHQPSKDDQVGGMEHVSANRHQTNAEQHNIFEQQGHGSEEMKHAISDDQLWQKRRISDTWSQDAHAVVSIMSLYVNGTAQKMEMEDRPIHKIIGAAGSDSNVLEITLAYKMIAIPKYKVHWKNFIIPAAMTDVSAMLAADTKDIWGHSVTDNCECSSSLCDLGLSMVDPSKWNVKKDASGERQTAQDPGIANRGSEKSMAVHEETAAFSHSEVEIKAAVQEAPTTTKPSNKHDAAQDTSAGPTTGATVVTDQKLSPINSAIEYLIWRHTEDILSVCIVPLTSQILSREEEVSGPPSPGGASANDLAALQTARDKNVELEVPLALTCGDMSGHRICTSASFFAFEFLMDVLRRLPFVKQTPYVVSLQQRIDAACRGHIRWLEWVRKPWYTFPSTESLLSSGRFAANYWVDGQINSDDDSASWQPIDGITDTPFQILKITAYVKWLQTMRNIESMEDEGLGHHMALLRDIWVFGIHELNDLDKRKACAWPHTIKDRLDTYRLDDHVWLWKSLSELHGLGLWDLTGVGSKSWKDSPNRWTSNIYPFSPTGTVRLEDRFVPKAWVAESFAGFSGAARRLLPNEVQKAVLQRFTVENDVSGERMLAVTRSARETRFFFHTRDTALLYGHGWEFFRPETSFSALWERTIKSQSHHEEALEEEWRSPLRLALGALVGLNGFSIDKRSPAELIKRSLEALIQVSAHNAFIPGEVDVATRKPSIFSEERDRDYYYHVGFEVCHMLLENARGIDVAFRSGQAGSNSPAALTKQAEDNSGQLQSEILEALLSEKLAQPKKQKMANHQHGQDYSTLAKLLGMDGRLERKRNSMVMKRIMPYNNMIDASRIIPLDEEWLYNYPDFLLVKNISLREELERLFDRESSRYKSIYESASSIIDDALESLNKDRRPPESFSFTLNTVKDSCEGLVADLPKQKSRRHKRGKRDLGASLFDLPSSRLNEVLWDVIGQARSAITAKKRFLWLPACSNSQTAFLCWLASTEAEKSDISLFFDRHAEYDNHMWDDTTMVLNTWQTELHMCFWMVCEKSEKSYEGLPNPVRADWPRGSTRELRRASMGFRFDGDFFDRYWTCHFIQYVPGSLIGSSSIPEEWTSGFRNEKHSWQRKVLELQLLQHMLNLILTGSNELLESIQDSLGLKKGSLVFSVLTTEAYSTAASHWQTYEAFLEKAEEDISSSLNTLSKWATREDDRGQERPRWTRNDESKYRGYINKLRNHTERQRWDLDSCRDKMRKLRETLITRQEKSRAVIEANREQNIRYFTYVTVIFLPLGFASSFYSMNGAPSNDLIISLAKFAAAAFIVTAILVLSVGVFSPVGRKALSSMKDAANLVVKGVVGAVDLMTNHTVRPLQRYSLHTRQDSLLVKGTSSNDEPDKSKTLHQAYSKKDWMLTYWFWPAYLILELPTLAISTAWTTVGTGSFSLGAVWRVALGIVVIPIYAMSRAILSSFGNAILLLKISRHLYHRCKDLLPTKRTSEIGHTPEMEVAREKPPDEQVRPRQPPLMGASEKRGDSENIPAGNEIFPDHFEELMPTTEPFRLLQSLERRLGERKSKAGEGKNSPET